MKPYDRGIDYSGFRPDPHDVARNGARFVIRYSAGVGNDDADMQWKLCEPAEIADAAAAGLDFVANSESYAERPTEGAAAGRADGAADAAFWRSRGLAQGAAIYVSWDAAPQASRYDAVEAYLRGYGEALAGRYRVGLYGGDPALREMLRRGVIDFGWRSMSDSFSGDGEFYQPGSAWREVAAQVARVSPAALWQNGNRWYGSQADEDVVLRTPVGSHREAGGAVAGPVQPVHPVPRPPAPPRPSGTGVYLVRRGDTLSAIAAAHGISLAELERLNPRAGHPPGHFDLILPGDRIVVPGAAARPGTHVVQPGETLSSIAADWGVSLAALERANPRAGHPPGDFDVIWPGDVIRHP
jgi:LysM repeat protein